jgi:hypothetical protein
MTSAVSNQTVVYYTPYVGNQIPLYNGTSLVPTTFIEISQATTDATKSPAAVAANQNYDVFVWSDSGTVRCTRGPAWSSDTARGTGLGTTELQMVQGVLTNRFAITNGPAANRGTFVGTIRSNASSQIDFTFGAGGNGGVAGSLNVWNCYNRADIWAFTVDTISYTYATSTVRQAHGATGNKINFISGLAEDCLIACYTAEIGLIASAYIQTGIGLDSITNFMTFGGKQIYAAQVNTGTSTSEVVNTSMNIIPPQLGWHYVAALENSDGTHASTFNNESNNMLQIKLRM